MRIKSFLNRLWGGLPADPVDRVETNAQGFVIWVKSSRFTVPWEKVRSIAIQHFGGPGDSERTHYVLALADREMRVAVSTPGMNEFIQRLQRVPDLKRRDYMLAIMSGNEYPVVIWENPQPPP